MWLVAVVGRCLAGCEHCEGFCSVSTCFGHHYAHLQDNKGPVTAFGMLFCNKRENIDISRDIFCVENLVGEFVCVCKCYV